MEKKSLKMKNLHKIRSDETVGNCQTKPGRAPGHRERRRISDQQSSFALRSFVRKQTNKRKHIRRGFSSEGLVGHGTEVKADPPGRGVSQEPFLLHTETPENYTGSARWAGITRAPRD